MGKQTMPGSASFHLSFDNPEPFKFIVFPSPEDLGLQTEIDKDGESVTLTIKGFIWMLKEIMSKQFDLILATPKLCEVSVWKGCKWRGASSRMAQFDIILFDSEGIEAWLAWLVSVVMT